MSLQERTLVVRNFDPERTTERLLRELCLQGGPVRKVILRSDHAFVEFDDIVSVGYTKALLDGVQMFDRPLSFEPKLRNLREYKKYTDTLNNYINFDRRKQEMDRQRQLQQDQMRMQMQYQQQMQMQYQQPSQYQMPPQPYRPPYQPNQAQQAFSPQFHHQPQPSNPRPPDYRGPQFRNYR